MQLRKRERKRERARATFVTSGRESDVSVRYVRQPHVCDVRERIWRVCAVRQTVPCLWRQGEKLTRLCCTSDSPMFLMIQLYLEFRHCVLCTRNWIYFCYSTVTYCPLKQLLTRFHLIIIIVIVTCIALYHVKNYKLAELYMIIKKLNNTPVQLCHPSNTQPDSRIISVLCSSTTLMSAFVKIRTGNGCFESSAFLF